MAGVTRYQIPTRYLHDLISGAEMDLTVTRYETFDRLREYCYRVAGTVGLCCLCVFGYSDPRAPELAETLGIAFQLTNILRDLRKDYQLGRIYLPAEDLARFQVQGEDLGRELDQAGAGANVVSLVRFESERAWQLYAEGWPLISLVHEDSRHSRKNRNARVQRPGRPRGAALHIGKNLDSHASKARLAGFGQCPSKA